MKRMQNERGVTLIEMVTMTAIFTVFSLALATTFINATKMTLMSADKIRHTAILDSIIESLHENIGGSNTLVKYESASIPGQVLDLSGNPTYSPTNNHKIAVYDHSSSGAYYDDVYFQLHHLGTISDNNHYRDPTVNSHFNGISYTPDTVEYKKWNFQVSVYQHEGGSASVIEKFHISLTRP